MAPGIVKVLGRFIRWSSVCDAPTQLFDSFDDAMAWCEHKSQRENLRRTGTTTYGHMSEDDIDRFALWNRAGPNETCIGRETMISALEGMPVRLYVNGAWGWWKNTGRWETTQDPNAELALLRLKLAAAPRWVSVSEGLPEDRQTCAIIANYPYTMIGEIYDGLWRVAEDDGEPLPPDIIVTHWLKLPPTPDA
jgi:hypothetical protein